MNSRNSNQAQLDNSNNSSIQDDDVTEILGDNQQQVNVMNRESEARQPQPHRQATPSKDEYVPSNTDSYMWSHVHLKKSENGKLFCNYCPSSWKYDAKNKSLQNAKRHVDNYHPEEESKREREAKEEAKARESNKRKYSQLTLEDVSGYSLKLQKKLNVGLVIDLCIRDLQPFRSVSRTGMRNLLRRHDPRFKPTDQNGASAIVDQVYKVIFPLVKSKISTWLQGDPKRFISSCGDLWKSAGNEDYYGVMIAWIDDDWKLEVYVAGCPEFDMDDHSGDSHKIKLACIFENLGIEFSRVIANTTDGDPKITRGMLDLFESTADHACHHLRCSPHTLELVPKHCLLTEGHRNCDLLCFTLIRKIKNIVSFFHSSPTQEKIYKTVAQQNSLKDTKFIQSNDTRWTSTQDMLESVAFAEEALTIYTLRNPEKFDLPTAREFRAARQMLGLGLGLIRFITRVSLSI
jgi:hypothetical protein